MRELTLSYIDSRPKMQFRPLSAYFILDHTLKSLVTLPIRQNRLCLMLKKPVFHASDKSQSDFLRLTSEKIALTSEKNTSTSEKWALTSEKHEWHIIWGTTLTQLDFQCASEVSQAALGLEIRGNTFYLGLFHRHFLILLALNERHSKIKKSNNSRKCIFVGLI